MKLGNQKGLIVFGLVLLATFAWQKFYLEPKSLRNAEIAAASQVMSQTTPPSKTEIVFTQPVETQSLKLESGEAILGSGPTFFSDWNLSLYTKNDLKKKVDLQSITEVDGGLQLSFDSTEYAYLSHVSGQFVGQGKWKFEDSKVTLTRDFESDPKSSLVNVVIRGQFKDKAPQYAFVGIQGRVSTAGNEVEDRALVYFSQKEITRTLLKEQSKIIESIPPVRWIGISGRYFLFSWLNETSGKEPWALVQPVAQDYSRISMVYPISGNTFEIRGKAFFAPKELPVLRAIDPTLDHTVDFGFFTVFAYPLLKFLKWLNSFANNYGVAIILLTLALKLVTYPLTYKSVKAMKQMSKIQPQLEKIKEKYKDDKETLNREMLSLMKTQGYNPMAGCLPVLLQIPIFFALNRVLYVAIELYHAPFLLWIADLSAKDPYYVTPVLLSILMYVQQKMMPSTVTDPVQAKMMQFMPLVFGLFMVTLPSGLTLYMLTNSIAGIVQQLILNKKFDTGRVPSVAAKA